MPLIFAYNNTPTESLELTRWVDTGDPEIKQKIQELMVVAQRLFPKFTRNQNTGKNTMMAAGTAEGRKPRDFVTKHRNMIHYALYEGRCLDPQRLSYFLPERTIEEGYLTEEEVRKILEK